MSGEVERPQAELSDADAAPGDLVGLGIRLDGKVTKYSWALLPEDGVVVEMTPHYVREEPVYTDVVIRFRTTA